MHDIRRLIDAVENAVTLHNLGKPGVYRRFTKQNAAQSRDLGINPYGCADAANVLYTIGRFPRDSGERSAWTETLQNLQNPETGFFHEKTHHEIHCTAHCIAALELFDAAPLHPIRSLEYMTDLAAMESFLDKLDWRENPWNASHKGAGVYVAMKLTGMVSTEWEDRYFNCLWKEFDSETGLLRKGCITPVKAGNTTCLFPHLAGTFHYLFNMEYARRPLPYPEKMLDCCLNLYRAGDFPSLGASVGFAEIDWVYCLTRSLRQCGYKFEECRKTLEKFADFYIHYLQSLNFEDHSGVDDLHCLFGAVCALAELEQALPGYIRTDRPLKLVLDRRPFI